MVMAGKGLSVGIIMKVMMTVFTLIVVMMVEDDWWCNW